MSSFEERPWIPETQLTGDEVAYYRKVLDTQPRRSPDWIHAYNQLAVAGDLMGTPDRWEHMINSRWR